MPLLEARPGAAAGRWAGRPVLARPVAFALVAYAFAVNMLGTTLPTPLYGLLQRQWHFSELTLTVVFAVYAAGVIAALLLFGRVSDDLGRRVALLAGLVLSAASAACFLAAHGLALAYVGRVLSGLSAGLFTGAGTAALVDLQPEGRAHGALVATACNIGGLGLGPLLAGVLAQLAPLPTRLVFVVDLVLLVPALLAVWAAPETVRREPGARLRLQRLAVPREVRSTFAWMGAGGFCAFFVLGLFTGVTPSFLARTLGISKPLVSGAVVFALFATSALSQVVLQRVPRAPAVRAGLALVVLGLLAVAGSLAARSLALLLVCAGLAGVGHGLVFRAGLEAVTEGAPAELRANVASAYFVVMYLAISVPVIGVGVVAEVASLRLAGIAFAGGMAVLALVVLVRTVVGERER